MPITIGPERPRFSVSTETRVIYDRIVCMAIGEMVGYQEFSKLIGDNVQDGARASLNSARRMAQRNDHIVTDVVPRIGIKRLSDQEVVSSSDEVFGRVRRAARRGIDKVTSVGNFENLSPEMKIKHNAAVSALGVIGALSKPKEIHKIEAAVNTSSTGQLPIGRTLEILRRPTAVEDDKRETA